MAQLFSENGIALIKESENNRYQTDFVHDDGAGNLTAGYGHKVTSSDDFEEGDYVSESQASQMLQDDLPTSENVVKSLVDELPVSQNEFDALVDLAYNVGPKALSKEKSPGLNKAIENGDYGAMHNNLIYTKANGSVMGGLKDRSLKRQKLFKGSLSYE